MAKGYSLGSKGISTVFEIPQGMINRGADISWLSQYPHEREILFGPLSGIEVRALRTEGPVIVVEALLNVNLSSLTLEQVVSKRHKMVRETCANLALELNRDFEQEWRDSRVLAVNGARALGDAARESALRLLGGVPERPAHEFNDDAILVGAIQKATEIRQGPQSLLQLALLGTVAEGAFDRDAFDRIERAKDTLALTLTGEVAMRFEVMRSRRKRCAAVDELLANLRSHSAEVRKAALVIVGSTKDQESVVFQSGP